VIVVPLSTAAVQARRGATAVLLPEGSGGLRKASVALCHQVTTLDRSRLSTAIGTLTPWLLQHVSAGLAAAMDVGLRR